MIDHDSWLDYVDFEVSRVRAADCAGRGLARVHVRLRDADRGACDDVIKPQHPAPRFKSREETMISGRLVDCVGDPAEMIVETSCSALDVLEGAAKRCHDCPMTE